MGVRPVRSATRVAGRVAGWLDAGRPACVYYNNDAGGHAVDNAGELKAMLEK